MNNSEKIIKGLESQLDDLSKYADSDEVLTLTQDQAKDILFLLKDQPEIVRCKDCKHFEPDGIYTMCYRHNGLSQNADWFCAYAERRDAE